MFYSGLAQFALSDEEVAAFYEGRLDLDLKINEYLILKNSTGEVIDKRRWDGKEFKELTYARGKGVLLKPKTVKQECLADLICNKNIPIKIITGVPGSGKSRLAIFYGLTMLMRGEFQKMFIVRHNVGIGEKNGYLPGSKEDKILAWLGFLKDNLGEVQYTIPEMIEREMIELESPEYIKGRDIKNAFMIIDECEDLTTDQFRVLGERVSQDSVVCFVGDYNQATLEKYKNDSGLKRAFQNLPGNPFVGFVSFEDPEDNLRSEASKVFTTIY